VSPPAGGHVPGAHLGGAVPRHHIVTAMVENKAGVLARVASLFSRRGFNIFSLAVAPTDDERFSRITIVVDVESAPLEQIMKQLDKLVNVVTITELAPEEAIEREMLLVTVAAGATAAERADLVALVGEYGGSIVDDDPDQERGGRVTVMLAGTPSRIDDFEDMVRPFGITELQRTGLVALPKLSPDTAPLQHTA
jgi:acetolactate synthase I/III small subunit